MHVDYKDEECGLCFRWHVVHAVKWHAVNSISWSVMNPSLHIVLLQVMFAVIATLALIVRS